MRVGALGAEEELSLMDWLGNLFRPILDAIYYVIPNYGWAVVVFTVLVKLLLLPLDIKSKRSMKRMAAVQPKIDALTKKYANDKEKLNKKMMEVYQKEKISPMSGCMPLLIQMPLLFGMFAAMRIVANEENVRMLLELKAAAEAAVKSGAAQIDLSMIDPLQSFFWIKNVFQPDSFMSTIIPAFVKAAAEAAVKSGAAQIDLSMIDPLQSFFWIKNVFQPDSFMSTIIPAFGDQLMGVYAMAGNEVLTQANIDAVRAFLSDAELYGKCAAVFHTDQMANYPVFMVITTMNVTLPTSFGGLFTAANGLFLLPLLAGGSQLLATKLTPGASGSGNNSAAGTGPTSFGGLFTAANGLFLLPLLAGGSQLLATKLTPGASGSGNNSAAGTGKFMMYFFPIFSIWICATSNAAFSIYWVASNLIQIIQTFAVNKWMDAEDKKAALQKEGE